MERVVGREMLGEESLELDFAVLARLLLLIRGARFVVEVAWTGDVGVLEAVGPGTELAGTGLGEGDQI